MGLFPDKNNAAIAKGSNAAIAKIGDRLGWYYAYPFNDGTCCNYRTGSMALIRVLDADDLWCAGLVAVKAIAGGYGALLRPNNDSL